MDVTDTVHVDDGLSFISYDRLHHRLLDSIMHSPMCFFDTTPLGRIVNRFSKDMDAIDVLLKRYLQEFVWSAFDMLGMIVAISYATPLFLVVLPPLGVLYFYIQVRSCTTIAYIYYKQK